MDSKPRPNDRIYLEILRAMSPADRLLKAFELSEFTRTLALAGLKHQFPDRSEEELKQVLAKRMIEWHLRRF